MKKEVDYISDKTRESLRRRTFEIMNLALEQIRKEL